MQIGTGTRTLQQFFSSNKYCCIHQRQALKVCSDLQCKGNVYLCDQCLSISPNNNQYQAHREHLSSILDLNQFAKSISQAQKQISLHEEELLCWNSLKELKKIKNDILERINQSIQRIEADQVYRYYMNEQVLQFKLDFEQNESWIVQLKKQLAAKKRKKTQHKNQMVKTQITILQEDIHLITSKLIQNNISFHNHQKLPLNIAKPSKIAVQNTHQYEKKPDKTFTVTFSDKKVYSLACVPFKIFNFFDSMLVCSLTAPSLLYNLVEKTAIPINFPLTHFSAGQNCFFVVTPPSTLLQFKLEGVQIDQFSGYKQQIVTICCIDMVNMAVIATGYADGMLQLYGNRTRIHSQRKIDSRLNHIQKINDTLYSCFENGHIIVYKIGNRNLQFVLNVSTTIRGLQGICRNDSGRILYWNNHTAELMDVVTRKLFQKISFLSNDTRVAKINEKNILFVVESSMQGYLIGEDLESIQIDCKILCSIQVKNSWFIYSNSLWVLKKNSTDLQVYSIVVR